MSATNPDPSPLFDGAYYGTRHSAPVTACGVDEATGKSSARVQQGRLRLRLFGPQTALDGTVGADGTVRASGLWKSPSGYPNMTVLHGHVADGVMTGTASDFRCVTDLKLRRIGRR